MFVMVKMGSMGEEISANKERLDFRNSWHIAEVNCKEHQNLGFSK